MIPMENSVCRQVELKMMKMVQGQAMITALSLGARTSANKPVKPMLKINASYGWR
jgi:hypothetical protein